MTTDRRHWDTSDFEQMSWHDVHVHGFRFARENPEQGTIDLILDIDYILEWRCEDERFAFAVAQAALTFREVFGLKFSLDYATPTIGMCAFSIGEIKREEIVYPTGHRSYRWLIDINCPDGRIEFQSPGFVQQQVGEPRMQAGQRLDEADRNVSDRR
jgi:hypothetical protein